MNCIFFLFFSISLKSYKQNGKHSVFYIHHSLSIKIFISYFRFMYQLIDIHTHAHTTTLSLIPPIPIGAADLVPDLLVFYDSLRAYPYLERMPMYYLHCAYEEKCLSSSADARNDSHIRYAHASTSTRRVHWP